MYPFSELWKIIDRIVLHLLCLLLNLVVNPATSTNKPAKQHWRKKKTAQYTPQMIIILCQWNIFLDLHSAIIFNLWNHSLIGSWGFIGCLLLSMPRRRALSKKTNKKNNIKTPTWIHQCMIGMPNVLFVSWRYSTKTAGFFHLAFLCVLICAQNVRRVEILWLRKTDSCSSAVDYILPSLEKLLVSLVDKRKHLIFILIYSSTH